MKTIEQIDKEVLELKSSIKNITGTFDQIKSAENKARSRISFLRTVRTLLESNPSREYLLREEERLLKMIKIINNRCDELYKKFDGRPIVKIKCKELQDECNYSKMKVYLSNIQFILN